MKNGLKKYSILLITAGVVILLDQWTKFLVRSSIPLNASWLPESLLWLAPYARFVYIENSGASFGMLQGGNTIFMLLAFAVVGGILYYISKLDVPNRLALLATGMYLGGAVGNLIDRLAKGAVTDFISVGSFYIFNIADASINVAVVLLLISFWAQERNNPAEAELNERTG
jgi:signal peptidase II